MTKTHTITTTETYDKDGKLLKRIVTDETTEDDTAYTYNLGTPSTPFVPFKVPTTTPCEITC